MPGIDSVNWAQQGLNFGSSLLSFGLSQIGSAADSKRAFKYWNRQRDRIRKEAIADYYTQRANARKDTLEQYQLDVAAKKNAGLNPALGEGQGAVTMSQPNIDAQDNGAIQSQSGQVQYNPLLMAQLENIQADTLEKKKKAGLIDTQIDLNKQTFDQNLEKFPLELRIFGADASTKETGSKIARQQLKQARKTTKILDEKLKQEQATTRMQSQEEQVKGVEIFLRMAREYADYQKTVAEVGEVRSRTSLNYASAANQRAQAWLTPYQARNLASVTALNYAKVKTEGTQQRLNNMLYHEAGARLENWKLKNDKQRFDNKIRQFQSELTDVGINPECSNIYAMLGQLVAVDNRDAQLGGTRGLIGMYRNAPKIAFNAVVDWFKTGLDVPAAIDKLEKGVSDINRQNKESFHKWNYDWHKGLSDWQQNFDNMNRRRHVENGRVVYY